MEHPEISKEKDIKSIFFESSRVRFWDGDDIEEKARSRFEVHPYYKKIYDLANKTDTQHRQFYIERFSGGMLLSSQFIIDSDRVTSRRMFLKLTRNTSFVNSFRSSIQEISDFFLSGMDTIQKIEPNLVRVKPDDVKIIGVGRDERVDPYKLLHTLTEFIEKNSIVQVEKKIEVDYNEIIKFIIIKNILSEPVTIKNNDFLTSICLMSYLLPKMFGFDFRISIAEIESTPDSYDILFQKNLDNYDIDLSSGKFSASPNEREIYRDLWEYVVTNKKEFQQFITAGDKKALADALIGRFASQYKPKSSQGNIFSSSIGKKIGMRLFKKEIQAQSPDLAKKIESLFPVLTSEERKALTRELLDNRIIINYVISQEIYSGLTSQDFEVIKNLIKYNIPDYSALRSAIEFSFMKINWEDEKTIQSANSLLSYLLSMPVQEIGDGGRILGSCLFNELSSRRILNKDTNRKFSHKYKHLGIPEKHEKTGIFSTIQIPILIPIILVEAGIIIGAIVIFLQLSPPFDIGSYFQNLVNRSLSLLGDPILTIGIIIGLTLIIFLGVKRYFSLNFDFIRRKILKK